MSAAPPSPTADDARRTPLLVACFVALVICTNVGAIMAPSLVKRSPELLLGLSSRIRHLLFSVPAGISPINYAAIGFARLLAAAVICYLLGKAAGDRFFGYIERQLDGEKPATLRWTETAVEKAAMPLVAIFPGSNIVCFLAGRRRLPGPRFAVAIVVGIAFRLTWVWAAAKQFESQLTTSLDFIDRYQKWFIVALIVLTIVPSTMRSYRIESARARAEASHASDTNGEAPPGDSLPGESGGDSTI